MLVSSLDPVVLFGLGILVALVYAHWLHARNPDWYVVLAALVVGGFWLHALAVGSLGIQPWGGGPSASVPPLVTAGWWLAYPFWFWLGSELVFLLIGRTPEQGGVLWVVTLRDRTASFERSWRK